MDKLICVGKNYLKHAIELGDAVPEEPMYFIKPPSTLVEAPDNGSVEVTWPGSGELHHEVELVFRLTERQGEWSFSHYTFGLDMTLRDLQTRLKKAGLPWEKGKTFRNAAIIGPWRQIGSLETVLAEEFSIRVNGEVRQKTRGSEMRWQPPELLTDLQRWFPLREGDALFTGTPEGVAAIADGDVLEVAGGDIRYSLKCRREPLEG